MNILFRANSSSFIGTGHIMRSLVLAKQFKDDNIIFASENLAGNINEKIVEASYKLEILKNNDFENLDFLIKSLDINMLVIDSYDINYDFEKKLKQGNPNLKLFVFDDMYKKHHCDILLNHNIYANKKRYKNLVPKNCELRCGAKYTLLREEFKEAKKNKVKKDKKNINVFLAMGGADHKNLNIKILKSLKKVLKSAFTINLVTTKANKNLASLQEYCKNKAYIKLHINSNKIAKLMTESDFAIATPSVTLNELYYLKVPFIAIKTANNQKKMYYYLKKKGYYTMKKFDKNILKKYLKLFLKGKR